MGEKRHWGWLGFILVTLVAVRMLVVVSGQGEPHGINTEALVSGRLAFDLLNGSWRGWHQYLYDTGGHVGNEVAVGILALPVFALFGRSLIALSLVPIVASVLIVLLLCELGRSQRAAWLASAYFVLVPTRVHTYLVNPYFSHMESAFFFLASLWLLKPVWEPDGAAPVHWLRPFAAGAASGLGIVLCDTQWVPLVSVLVAWTVSGRRRRAAWAWGAFGVGLVIGLLPYVGYVYYRPARVLEFYGLMTGNLYNSIIGVTSPGAEVGVEVVPQLSYIRSAAQLSAIFWPLGNFAWSSHSRAVAGLAGMLGLAWYAIGSRRVIRKKPMELSLLLCVFTYTSICLALKNEEAYYLYVVLPPVSLLAGRALSKLELRVRVAGRAFNLVPLILVAAAAVSFAPFFWTIQPDRLPGQWRAAQVARGYAFFAFHGETYGVYSGYKTRLGQDVENYATSRSRADPSGAVGSSGQVFFSADGQFGHAINDASDYYLFGMDVTTLGIGRLSARIRQHVPVPFQNEAFGATAVLAANDFLLEDLLEAFEDGTIDSSVPQAHAHHFYSELGRKIKDRRAESRPRVRAFVDSLSSERRDWLEGGMAEARYVDYHIAALPGRRRPWNPPNI